MREYMAGNILSQFGASSLNSWREHTLEMVGGANELTVSDTMPNIFIIQNTTPNELKVSLSGVASEKNYEFKVPANSTKPVGTPIPKGKISIYNGTANKFTLKIFSVSQPLDLAMFNETNVSMGSGIEVSTDGIVKGFGAGVSLPAGNNTIGAVELGSVTKNNIASMSTNIAELVNGANLSNLYTELRTLNTFISTLVSNGTNDQYTTLGEILKEVAVKKVYVESKEQTVSSSSPIDIVKDITRICYVSNDGESAVTVTLSTPDGSKVLTVRAGEVLTDVKCDASEIVISATASVSVRCAVEYTV